MTTPQEFLSSFLREKAAIYANANAELTPLHKKYFGEPLSAHAGDFLLHDVAAPFFDDVKQSAGSALVIIREHFRPGDIRRRYDLRAVGDTWKIVRIERECFRCHGTGRCEGTICHICGGEGWHDRQDVRPSRGSCLRRATAR